jgi:hypothetical protein
LAARTAAFVILGMTVFWHRRPMLLLWAGFLMLVSFIGVTLPPSALRSGIPWWIDLICMILCQIALGFALGMIYAASLYFGMVLSGGSTEHSGYHEALIGCGNILGPGVGAAAIVIAGGSLWAGVTGIAGVVAISVVLAGGAGIWLRRNP